MKLILLTSLLTTTLAFAPATLPATRTTTTSRHLSAVSALPKISLPKVSNPYKSLPWVAQREENRAYRQHEFETAALYRELGLPYNAEYEQVKERTDELIDMYNEQKDVKSRIKVEVARDKIYMLNLSARIEGVANSSEEDGEDASEESLKKEMEKASRQSFRMPLISNLIDFGYSVYTPPDDAWRKRQFVIWGLSTLFCLVNPPMVENFSRVNWLAAGGMMGYRGMPGMENKEPGYNPFRGKRNKAHQVQAMGVAVAVWVVAKMVAESVVMKIPALVASRSCEWFKFAIVQGVLCLSCLYVKTYKGEGGKELMI